MDEPEIVRRVGGNDQDVFPCLSQLHTVREGKQWAEAREGENECAGSENGTVLREGSAGKNRENTSTETRHKHRRTYERAHAARRSGLPDTTLAADEDPAKGRLVDQVLETGVERLVAVDDSGVGHGRF